MSDVHGTKRLRSDDEGDDGYEPKLQHTEERRAPPPHGSGSTGYSKSFETEMIELARNVCSDIMKLGGLTPRALDDITNISRVIANEFETADVFRSCTLEYLQSMVVEQPHKVFYMSALIQVSNSKNGKVGQYVVEYFHQKCQELLDRLKEDVRAETDDELQSSDCGTWTKLKLFLRFFATLVPILEADSVVQVFKQFFKIAADLQEQSKESPLAQLVFYNTATSIPYLAAADTSLASKCDELLEIAKTFEVVETPIPELLRPFTAFEEHQPPYELKPLLGLVIPALEKLKEQSWKLFLFPDLRVSVVERLSEEQEQTVKHAVPQFNVPPLEVLLTRADLSKTDGNMDSLWQTPRFVMDFFPSDDDLEVVPAAETFEAIILRDIFQDMIQNLEFNRKTCGTQMRRFAYALNPHAFAQLNSSVEKLTLIKELNNGVDVRAKLAESGVDSGNLGEYEKLLGLVESEWEKGYKSTWKVETVMANSLLDLMFHLPESPNPAIYYQVLLMDYCSSDIFMLKTSMSLNRSTIAKVIGSAVRFLYTNSVTLDFELRLRFIDWLLVQLSNFNFEWQWGEWAADVELSPFHPRNYVIANVIAKELRVSTVDTVKPTLPEEFHKFLDLSIMTDEEATSFDSKFFGDVKPEGADLLSQFVFNNAAHPHQAQCYSIYENLQGSGSNEEFDTLIGDLKQAITQEGKIANADEYIVTLLGQAVCIIGSRSLTVIDGALDIVSEKLLKVLDSTGGDSRTWLVDGVVRLWRHEPRIAYLVLEKMFLHGLIAKRDILKSVIDSRILARQTHAVELVERLMDQEFYELLKNKLVEQSQSSSDVWEKYMISQLLRVFERKY